MNTCANMYVHILQVFDDTGTADKAYAQQCLNDHFGDDLNLFGVNASVCYDPVLSRVSTIIIFV